MFNKRKGPINWVGAYFRQKLMIGNISMNRGDFLKRSHIISIIFVHPLQKK